MDARSAQSFSTLAAIWLRTITGRHRAGAVSGAASQFTRAVSSDADAERTLATARATS
jgi:hypothetical protein